MGFGEMGIFAALGITAVIWIPICLIWSRQGKFDDKTEAQAIADGRTCVGTVVKSTFVRSDPSQPYNQPRMNGRWKTRCKVEYQVAGVTYYATFIAQEQMVPVGTPVHMYYLPGKPKRVFARGCKRPTKAAWVYVVGILVTFGILAQFVG